MNARSALFGLLLFIGVAGARAQRPPQIPWIVSEIERDYSGTVDATDRTWFYLDQYGASNPSGGGKYPDPEFQFGRGYDAPAIVAVAGETVTLQLKLENQHSLGVSGTFTLTSVKIIPPVTWSPITLTASASNTSLSMAAWGGTDVVTITFTAPSSIALGDLEIKYNLALSDGVVSSSTDPRTSSWEDIYVPLNAPTGLQTVPWTDLLEYSCSWAFGNSTTWSVLANCTDGLYFYAGFSYDALGPEFYGATVSGYYDLKSALINNSMAINCEDVAGFLHLAAMGQGISTTLNRIQDSGSLGFVTNYICPMGSDPTNSLDYQTYGFNYHLVPVYFGSVFDAAAAHPYDLGATLYQEPPKNWYLQDYWQTPHLSAFLGLTDRLLGAYSSQTVTLSSTAQALTGVR